MRTDENWRHSECIKCIILFFLLCVFFYFVPYTDDDLRWGSQTGLNRLADGFAGYGGRYLGYIIVMGLTRSIIFKVLFMSTIVTMLAYLVRYITNLQIAPYVVILSIMVAPLSLFRSTIGWVSGFSNYVTSVCFTLLYIAYITYFERKEDKRHSIGATIFLCLLGIINTLIVEHFTIYNVLLGLFVPVLFLLKNKRVFVQFIGYVVGSFVGAWWMFSNSAYHKILAGDDSYRDVGSGNIIERFGSGLVPICEYGYFDNIVLNLAIFIALALIVSHYQKCLEHSKQTLVKGCLFVNLGYVAASLFMKKIFDGSSSVEKGVHFIVICISLLSILALIIMAVLFAKFYACFKIIVFLLISIVILNAPFLVVNPVTPRVFFGTYILFTTILCILIEQLCQEINMLSENVVAKLCKAGLIVGAVFYIAIFALIYNADNERLQNIKKQVADGKERVVMHPLPYEQFVHEITLYKKWELKGYKQFYHLPKDLKLVVEEESE